MRLRLATHTRLHPHPLNHLIDAHRQSQRRVSVSVSGLVGMGRGVCGLQCAGRVVLVKSRCEVRSGTHHFPFSHPGAEPALLR